jgi:hypothetical protein
MMNRRQRPRRLNYEVDIPFAVNVHQLEPQQRSSLLAWLRRQRCCLGRRRRHPQRTFYELDPITGTWERL